MNMPKGWMRQVQTLEQLQYNIDQYDSAELNLFTEILHGLKLMQEMASTLEIFESEMIPGSKSANDMLKKFQDWK